MGNIFEDPTLLIVGGLLAELVLGVVLWQTGRGVLLWYMAGVAALTMLGIVVERLVVTPREQITIMIDDARRAVIVNDLPGTLAFVTPEAGDERALVTDALRRGKFSDAKIHSLEIELEPGRNPQRAEARLTGMVAFRDQHGEFAHDNFPVRLHIKLERRNQHWLVNKIVEAGPWRPQAL